MLVAVFLTTCQTVFPEMPRPQSLSTRQTHCQPGGRHMPGFSNEVQTVLCKVRWTLCSGNFRVEDLSTRSSKRIRDTRDGRAPDVPVDWEKWS